MRYSQTTTSLVKLRDGLYQFVGEHEQIAVLLEAVDRRASGEPGWGYRERDAYFSVHGNLQDAVEVLRRQAERPLNGTSPLREHRIVESVQTYCRETGRRWDPGSVAEELARCCDALRTLPHDPRQDYGSLRSLLSFVS